MKRLFLLLFLFPSSFLTPQTDWIKWEKAETQYPVKKMSDDGNHSLSGDNFSESVLQNIVSAYWFFISDVDGDNCPFRPSCSRFISEAVKETNLPKGVLMFFDRFTRDMNIFNRQNKYPRFGPHYFYDPVYLYTLDENSIRYLPPNTFIQSE